MKQTGDINKIIQDSSWKEKFNNLKGQREQRATRLSKKLDMKFVGFMKELEEITYEHRYLERAKHKAARKDPEPWLSAQKITIFR